MHARDLQDKLRGVMAFAPTPFTADDRLDGDGLARQVDFLVRSGAHVVVVCGGVGEFYSLEPGEYREIRRYGSDDVRRLRFIRQAQSAGFTLEEIKELLDLDASEDRARARELAKARVKALDEKIAELGRARDALRRLARECGSGSAGPCPILTSFED